MVSSSESLTPSRRALLLALLVCSGAAGLMYEIVWFRALGTWFGSTVPAVATVLAAFMAGLAVGNLAFGRLADRSARPLALYRWLELGIALSGLVVSFALLEGGVFLIPLSRLVAGAGPLEGLLRFGGVFLLLMVPTTLMGGTLPAVARATVSAGSEGRTVGAIYAANTTGAVLGVLLPDLALIPWLGMWNTVLAAFCFNLLVVLAVGAFPDSPRPPVEERHAAAARISPWAVGLFAVSGFCAMGYEVVWSRLIQSMAGGLVLSFSVLLATYLAATAVGSWISRPFADRSPHPLAVAAAGLVLTGALAFLPIVVFDAWFGFEHALVPLEAELRRPPYSYHVVRSVLGSMWIAALPCLLMGLVFPFLAAAAVPSAAPGRGVGRLVAVNTLAGVLGSVAAGFWLLPGFGAQAALLALAGLAAVVGVVTLLVAARERLVLLAVGLLVALSLAGSGVLLPADHLLSSLLHASEERSFEEVIEGRTTMAAVSTHYLFGEVYYRELVTPGVSMSGTDYGARRYMGLMGHLPLFYTDGGERAALICYGVGNTARALLSHADLGGLDVIDIAEEVLELSPLFAEVTSGDPLEDPRARAFVDDGRHHMLVTDRVYDVITSEPPPPNHAGVVNLYSREYYAVARGRLTEGGVLAQWLPVFQLSESEILSMIAAFTAEFEHAALFHGHRHQWILLGSQQPLAIAPAAWSDRAAQPTVARDLADIGVVGAEDLAATFMLDDASLRALVADTAPLSDDLPIIQYPFEGYGALLDLPEGVLDAPVAGAVPFARDGSDADWRRRFFLAYEAGKVLRRGLHLNHLADPEWAELTFGTHLRPALLAQSCHPSLLAHLGINPDRLAIVRAHVEAGTARDEELGILARERYYCGDYEAALALLERMSQPSMGPREGGARYQLLLAGAARGAGRWEQAATAAARAAELSGNESFRAAMKALEPAVAAPWIYAAGPLGQPQAAALDIPAGTLLVTRHAEKLGGDDPMLSEEGLARAQALAVRLEDAELAAVYSTPTLRTRGTAGPTAEAHGLEITTYTSDDELVGLLARHPGESALIVGHSNTVPGILARLGARGPEHIDHGRYGDLFLAVPLGRRLELQATRFGD
jgi:spermidine synthase